MSTPRRHNKAKAATPLTIAKAEREKFSSQEELATWFSNLPDAKQKLVRNEFNNFIRIKTTIQRTRITKDEETFVECIVWNETDMQRGEGVGSRCKDEGRKTFKPYVWCNNHTALQGLCPATKKHEKGPEVNLATFHAVVRGFDASKKRLVCSHRCHNKCCLSVRHLTWEPQEANNHRNFCKRNGCTHRPKCLVDGPASDYVSEDKEEGVVFDD